MAVLWIRTKLLFLIRNYCSGSGPAVSFGFGSAVSFGSGFWSGSGSSPKLPKIKLGTLAPFYKFISYPDFDPDTDSNRESNRKIKLGTGTLAPFLQICFVSGLWSRYGFDSESGKMIQRRVNSSCQGNHVLVNLYRMNGGLNIFRGTF